MEIRLWLNFGVESFPGRCLVVLFFVLRLVLVVFVVIITTVILTVCFNR